MQRRFWFVKMRSACFTPLNLLILIIVENCLTITDCADPGRKKDKDVYRAPSTPNKKKLKNVEEAASTSGVAKGAGSSSRDKKLWSNELDRAILATYYENLRASSIDWNEVFPILRHKHPSLPGTLLAHDRLHRLVQKLIKTTPAYGEGNALWTNGMKSEVIRIYYQTRGRDEKEHALNMYNKWRNEHPLFTDISPMDLLHQAENMLIRHELLQPSKPLSKDRIKKINADRDFEFDSEQEEIIRKISEKIPLNEPIKIDNLYDELCKEDPRFCRASPQKLSKKARYITRDREKRRKKPRDGAEGKTDFLNPSEQEKRHHFYEFMKVQDDSPVNLQSAHHHAQAIGSSSSHQGSLYLHPGVDMSPDSFTVDSLRIHHPDVDLDLSLSSRKKKGESISSKNHLRNES